MKTHASIDGLDPNANHQTIQTLASGIQLVREVMRLGDWMTIGEVQEQVSRLPEVGQYYSESCIGARIRDQRKPRNGHHTVLRRLRANSKNLFEYKLILND